MKKRLTMVLAVLLALPLPGLTQLIQPHDLVYMGAFRLPEGSNGSDWNYSSGGMTYYPDGDPSGPADGYAGSIFAIGHDQQQYVSEISIPVPVISPAENVNDLNTATTLQGFHDITGGMFGSLEVPRADLAYLAPQGSQTTGKLHFCWGQHFQFEQAPSHGWCDLDLSHPQTAGPWYFGNYTNYISNDYLFEIPESWAVAHTPGQFLATGRFRDGGWGGQGPALLAYGPWNEGNPPPPNARLSEITLLLLYGIHEPGTPEIINSESMKMNNYKEADNWSGGAWLTASNNSAVIFVGTKAIGNCWYGFADGTVWPTEIDENTQYPEVPPWPNDQRGWWADDFTAQIMFYDPADLAAVAQGTMQPYEPQPYGSLDIGQYFYNIESLQRYQKSNLVGAADFDRERGFLYVFQRQADEDKSLVHVWKVVASSASVPLLNVRSITSSLTGPPLLGQNVILSFSASGQTSPLYYQYWRASGYQTSGYGNWQLLKEYSTDTSVTWTPGADDHYVFVVWVTDDQVSGNYHQAGLSVETSENSVNPIQILGLTTDMTYPQGSGTTITLHTNATGGSGPLYYQYFVRLEQGQWTPIRVWDTGSDATWTPTQAGVYTVVVWVSDDTAVTEPPLAGMTCTIGQ